MTVQFNKNSMTIILSFKEVADIQGARITTDTNQERAMTVTLKWKVFQVQGVQIWDLFIQHRKER